MGTQAFRGAWGSVTGVALFLTHFKKRGVLLSIGAYAISLRRGHLSLGAGFRVPLFCISAVFSEGPAHPFHSLEQGHS